MSIASVFVSVEPLRRQKDTDCFVRVFCLVGVARLVSREPCLRKCSRWNSDCYDSIASVFVSVEPLRRQKDTDCFVRVFCLVGVARLELAALRSRTVRATKLRYTPITMCFVSICCGAFGSASRISVRSCAFVNRFGDMFLF